MSNGASEPPPLVPPAGRNGCLTALMAIAGVILLLPGLCAVISGAASLYNLQSDFIPLVLAGLVFGGGGVALIRAALRGPRP